MITFISGPIKWVKMTEDSILKIETGCEAQFCEIYWVNIKREEVLGS